MGKRKDVAEDIPDAEESPSDDPSAEEESSSDDDDASVLDVEFEWFDPQPAHDFHGIKTLLRQSFDIDAQSFDLSALTDLILAQPLLGSTVKVEGNESDPYAFLTVLNLKEHSEKPVISDLRRYLIDRLKSNPASTEITKLLTSRDATVGLVLTERLINIPPEVVPPMYNMLLEEITWALDEKEPYGFSHYLILSKTYREVDSPVEQEGGDTRRNKKQKKSDGKSPSEIFYFHPEDDLLQKFSSIYSSFDYREAVEGQSDSKRTFQELGIKPNGHLILIESSKFAEAVKAMQGYFQQTQASNG